MKREEDKNWKEQIKGSQNYVNKNKERKWASEKWKKWERYTTKNWEVKLREDKEQTKTAWSVKAQNYIV
jgi:hypothetical protein